MYGPRSCTRSSCGTAALASEASGQRGNFLVRAPDTRPEPGSSARGDALPSKAPSVGVKNSATASEADNVAISVIGRYFMNCPTTPGQNRSGEKAATRVAVAAITGPAMRLAAVA